MKFLIVLCALVACGLAASVPKVQIATFHDSVKAGFGRIVNGQPAVDNQFPYQCSILSPAGGGSFYVCGGSIISASWTLTAAHCTLGHTQYNLRFGSLGLTTGGLAQTSFSATSHPDYNPTNLNNDISVVSIPTPLTFTPAIQAIRLPTAGQAGSTFVDVQAVVSGFGATTSGGSVSLILNWVHKRIISNADCAAVFGSAVVVPHVVCGMGYGNPNQSHCGGDSGGPLTILEGGITTLIGVVSFGAAAGCDLGFPAGYMRTANFLAWINVQTNIPIRP